ncbi:hypothetical protein [Halobacillus salinus]|uniref:Uncharacterized protein n=1 Tax=Halobacillus salinus TaxID=192814 RepID=A0A4Z0H2F4_9BACI|nr:hypothetical protein [Halobacillus salinus]TGB03586.1 hypothetical protein E4663_00850 [Halobacillus salinus]
MQMILKKLPRVDILLTLLFVAVVYITLNIIGINTTYVFIALLGAVEWATQFILPWIVLYWVIRLIKSYESK